ncbi:patatin-like phospholipase family protein [Allostreptomyces psammosilenae]|uniref:Putative patatin/cPLA2 family phospholipase n=1 Tax=Allostreptomyces psammosilenae TaxID=1892865 RepID=A0A852ZMC2_9ACTN|nr:patatin-like phospholipase family protein [Allostreptomyces psammosilenae]NYI03549.1 putative patatin/cPLA2 family phospholipase [Allostreptomyces psammosilenae]
MERTPWATDHPVLTALRRRRDEGSVIGNRTDGLKIGLAVEGGGIRGVVSAAMLTALEDLGLTSAFDAVYAASSGAVNAAYFLLGDTWYPLSIYYDDLSTRQFVDFRRAPRGAILNLDYAFDVVLDQVKPLDYEAVIASPLPLHIAVTLVDELRTEAVSKHPTPADLRDALMASAWLPVAIKGTAVFRGQRAVDGGVLTPHPFRLALDDGCTHVLSLSTRPIRPPRGSAGISQRYAARHLDRLRPGLGAGYLEATVRYRGERRMLQAWMADPPEQPPYVLDLAPLPWMPEVKRHELDPGRIIAGARGAYEVLYCAVNGLDPAVIRTGRLRAVPRLTIVHRPDGEAVRTDARAGTPDGRADTTADGPAETADG